MKKKISIISVLFVFVIHSNSAVSMNENEIASRMLPASSQTITRSLMVNVGVVLPSNEKVNFSYTKTSQSDISLLEILNSCPNIWETVLPFVGEYIEIQASIGLNARHPIRVLVLQDEQGIFMAENVVRCAH